MYKKVPPDDHNKVLGALKESRATRKSPIRARRSKTEVENGNSSVRKALRTVNYRVFYLVRQMQLKEKA
jgi:hypothetical protein